MITPTNLPPKAAFPVLGIGKSRAYEMIRAGELPPPIHMGSRKTVFPADEIATMAQAITSGANADQRKAITRKLLKDRAARLATLLEGAQ